MDGHLPFTNKLISVLLVAVVIISQAIDHIILKFGQQIVGDVILLRCFVIFLIQQGFVALA